MKYWLEIYGCQMNFAEGYALEGELKRRGWQAAASAEEADVAILHTCSVRQTAENRVWGRIGYFKHIKQDRPQKLVLMGCMAERVKEEVKKREPAIDMVVGNYSKSELPRMLERMFKDGEPGSDPLEEKPFVFQNDHAKEGDFHAYLPIMHGCNNFCSYCIVPYVRGREVSRAPEEILQELERLEKRGVKEITLLGQNVNSYFYENRLRFPDILKMIIDHGSSDSWIRFLTSHPKDVPEELIELLATEERLCRHLHLPVQHGSSTVLKRMNRKYTREEYESLVRRIRERVPEISLTTDLLIGFPGESEQDFEETLDLMRKIRFDDAYMYYFNPREGTPAAKFDDQVPHQTKLDRLAEVIELQRRIGLENKGAKIGTIVRALVDSVSKRNERELQGRTEGDQPVIFPGDRSLLGRFVELRLTAVQGGTLRAELV